jgi:putative tricarboxylic transport membrane protein
VTWRPQHEVELIAGTPAGGGQDRPARALIKVLQSRGLVDVPMKLTNIPGRGGGNGWDHLARHPGDAHLLGISSPTLVTNQLLGEAAINQDDLTPLAVLYTEYIVFVVRHDSPMRSGADVLRRLTNPASLTVALATAIGNINHIALALCTRHAGGDVKALRLNVFDSALYAVADVIEGRAELGAITAVSAVKALAAGKLRALALSSPERMPEAFASVPTWREQGVESVIGTWRGVTAPPGLTADEVAYWDDALRSAAQTDEWNEELTRHYWANTYRDSTATRHFLAAEQQVMRNALTELGLLRGSPGMR